MFRVQRMALAALVTFPLVAFLAGCGENPTGPTSTGGSAGDKEILSSLITSDPGYTQYFTPDGSFGTPQGAAEFGSILSSGATGNPMSWYRALSSSSRQMDMQVNGLNANVTIVTTMTGQLVLNGSSPLSGPQAVHTKPLVDVGTRYATFQRLDENAGMGSHNWKLVSISPEDIKSDVDGNPPTVQIQSVVIQPTGGDPVTITDPTIQLTRHDLVTVRPGQEVTVIVSHNDVDALAFLHGSARRGSLHFRMPFVAQDDGTFKAVFTAPHAAGVYSLTMDLLTKGSLENMDPTAAPYDSNQWSVMFRVGPLSNQPATFYEDTGA